MRYLGQSPTAWLTVEDAAHILRVSTATIYRNLSDVPHTRLGTDIRIPCEWLYLEPPRVEAFRHSYPAPRWYEQLQLPFEVKPERRWRNTKRRIYLNPLGYPD
jgi:hypothetical protein